MLVATNRQASGEGYRLMADALTRLSETTVRTSFQTGSVEGTRIFCLIEEANFTRKTSDGRTLDLQIAVSDWTCRSINSKNVPTLRQEYFRLRQPVERPIFELARIETVRSANYRRDRHRESFRCWPIRPPPSASLPR